MLVVAGIVGEWGTCMLGTGYVFECLFLIVCVMREVILALRTLPSPLI